MKSFAVLFNQFLIGVGWGWTAPTLLKFQERDSPLHMNAQQISWIVSIHEIGRIASPFVSPFIVDNIGRRYSIALVSIMAVLIWLGHIFVHNFYLLCTIRLIFGITNGLQDVASPIYTTENCSAELRKMIALMLSIVFSIGGSLELILTLNLTYQMTAFANTLLAVCTLGTLYFCVETPQYSIMKGKHSEAERNLAWLQGGLNPSDLTSELEKLRSYVHKENEKRASIKTLLSHPENVKGIGVVFCIYLFSTATGGIAIGTYVTEIYSSAESLDLFLYTGQIIKYIFMVISPFLRAMIKETRTFLIISYLAIGLNHSLTGVLFYLRRRNYAIEHFSWVVFIFLTPYGMILSLTGPVQYVLRGELLPLSVRALGGSVAIITAAATGFIILKVFLPIREYFGIELNFFLYSFMAFSLAAILHFCLTSRRESKIVIDKEMEQLKSNV